MAVISHQEVPKNDESKPLVSVIINCYDGEEYLREAIESVLNQTYQNWEIVFWDNQSTDKSAEIIKSFHDSRIKYFYATSHTKLYEARKLAVEKSSGDFLAFLDVDDTWEPFKLEKQVPLFQDETVGLVCGNYWISRVGNRATRYRRKIAISNASQGYVFNDLLLNYFVGLVTLVVRKKAYAGLQTPFDSRYNVIGDLDLVLRLASIWNLRFVKDPVATYRLHGSNLSSRSRLQQADEMEIWLADNKTFGELPCTRLGYEKMVVMNTYFRVVTYLLLGHRARAFTLWKKLPLGCTKTRGLALFILPVNVLKLKYGEPDRVFEAGR